MEKFKNLHKLKNRKTESWITLEIDIAPLLSKSNAMLNIYRAGYHPKDRKDVPFKSFAIPFSVIDENNKYEAHRVSLSSNLGRTRIEIGGSEPQHLIADLNLSPLGEDGDFAFPAVADIGFHAAKGQSAAFSDVEVRHFRSPSNLIFSEQLGGKPYAGVFSGSNVGVTA